MSIGQSRHRWALLALVAFACFAAPASAGAVTFPGAISGTVTDEVSAEPVANLEVCAYPLSEEGEEWRCSETDGAGEYEIVDLPAGEWGVEFWGVPLGYVPQYWEYKDLRSEADPVEVASTAVTGIDAELRPGGEIQGTVKEAVGGAPVEEVEVCAWGYPGEFFAGCTVSDSGGHYALRGLREGEYEIGFYPWGSTNLLSQYYDRRANWWESDLVPVAAEELVTGIDAELERGAQISGTVYSNATGAPLGSISVCAIELPSAGLRTCTATEGSGHYVLSPLPSGSYKVVFSIDFEEWYEEEFGEEENDGYPTEFWNDQTTLASANVISLTTGQSTTGIDAHLGPASPTVTTPSAVITPAPVTTAPITSPLPKIAPKPVKRCRKGFKRKKVKGEVRCVKRRKHHHRRHRAGRLG
jgi:hypothetical protein